MNKNSRSLSDRATYDWVRQAYKEEDTLALNPEKK